MEQEKTKQKETMTSSDANGVGRQPDRGRRTIEMFMAALVILLVSVLVWTLVPEKKRPLTQEQPTDDPKSQVDRPAIPPTELPEPTEDSAVSGPNQQIANGSVELRNVQEMADATRQPDAANRSVDTPKHNLSADFSAVSLTSGIVRILDISTTNMPTPLYAIRGQPNPDNPPNLWHVIAVTYESGPKWINELVFDYWVMTAERSRRAGEMVMSKRIIYLHVEQGVHTSAVYLHPNTFARFGPASKVAVSVSLAGEEVAFASLNGGRTRSWLTPTDRERLYSRRQTPFWLIDYDSFEFDKPKGNVAEQSSRHVPK